MRVGVGLLKFSNEGTAILGAEISCGCWDGSERSKSETKKLPVPVLKGKNAAKI